MAYPARTTPGGYFFHVYNRANGRATLFDSSADYDEFVRLVARCAAVDRMRILAWCIMPNHWHFLLWPRGNDDLSRFIQRLTIRHTKHWHIRNGTTGCGHIYQSRFKSSAVQDDRHLATVCRYIERNPVRAGLAPHAADWRWSSAPDRVAPATAPPLTNRAGPALSPTDGARPAPLTNGARPTLPLEPLPLDLPSNWWRWLSEPEELTEIERLRSCLAAGVPPGNEAWAREAAEMLGVPDMPRKRGRPRKPNADQLDLAAARSGKYTEVFFAAGA